MNLAGPRLAAIALALYLLLSGSGLAQTRPTTAGPGVHILPAMAMPGLDRTRIIRIYLPPDYEKSSRRYPVLYMHDGQNLFDDATSFIGEWGVDESLDRLAKSDGLSVIVVGIDNGQDKRVNELSPWTNARFGPAEGELYARFVVRTLKPYVDAHYRTLSDRRHTGVMGSSMGGLMSHYLISHYPKVFGCAGIISPSYWYAGDAVFADTKAHPLAAGSRVYLIAGDEEDEEMTVNVAKMTTLLEKQRRWRARLHSEIRAGGKHNEATWRSEFPDVVRWLFQR